MCYVSHGLIIITGDHQQDGRQTLTPVEACLPVNNSICNQNDILRAAVIQGISQQRLDERIPETGPALARIAHSIKSWRQVCPYFNLTAAEEQEILGDHPYDVASQRTSLLRKWRQKNFFTDATYRKLMTLFYLAGEHDAVEVIRAELL